MNKILLTGNTAWSMYNFRAGLIRLLQGNGFEVHVAAPVDPFRDALVNMGVIFHDLYIDNKGTSPRNDVRTIRALRALITNIQPRVVINYTIKPVIYGAMAAKLAGVPFFSVITGLGSPFISRKLSTRVIEFLCRATQKHAEAVLFLNRDDMKELVDRVVIPKDKARLLPSEGVDLSQFTVAPQAEDGPLKFLFAGRLLWQKGVGVFVDAARIVRRTNRNVVFQLLGPCGALNASAISEDQVRLWQDEGVIEYLGNTDDVRPFIAASSAVVLPSFYREGVPRILLEAAAMSRPIVTTDMPGCRDVVEQGVSGLLCQPKSAEDLAEKLLSLVSMSAEKRHAMGKAARSKVEAEFDESHVLAIYRNAVNQAVAQHE